MYCPRCAAQNLDDAKFCRACGMSLEAVAAALSGRQHPAAPGTAAAEGTEPVKGPSERRREGINALFRGGGLLAAALLIGIALGLFSNAPDWIIIWVCLAGWMACWGVISLASGIGAMIDARFMLQQQPGQADGVAAAPTARSLAAHEPEMIPGASNAHRLPLPTSVTEHATEPLAEHRRASKQAS